MILKFLDILKELEEKDTHFRYMKMSFNTIWCVLLNSNNDKIAECSIGTHRERTYYLYNLISTQNGGGTLILKNIINLAKKENIDSLVLSVYTKNERAIKLYKRIGFKELEDHSSYIDMIYNLNNPLSEIGINKPIYLDYKNAKFVETRYKGPESEILHTGTLVDMIDLGPYMAIIPPGVPDDQKDKYNVLLYSSNLFSKTNWQSGWAHFDPETIEKMIELIKGQIQKGNYKINY